MTWLTDANGNKCSVEQNVARLRFESSAKTDSCIVWSGYKDANGYGRIWVGRWALAHREAYRIIVADIEGIVVRHSCDNPGCINPAHLVPGTQIDNVRDRVTRHRGSRGERHPKAKLTESEVLEIRSSDESTRKLGQKYGVASSGISSIKRGLSWAHVPDQGVGL